MFGMGGSEILVILVIALIFLGPDKLPEAAKSISKGIRELRGATKEITQTIENDETIGGALRDIKSAMRGEEIGARPKPRLPKKPPATVAAGENAAELTAGAVVAGAVVNDDDDATDQLVSPPKELSEEEILAAHEAATATSRVTLPESAGEVDNSAAAHDQDDEPADDGELLAAMVRPAVGTVGRGGRGAVAPSVVEPGASDVATDGNDDAALPGEPASSADSERG